MAGPACRAATGTHRGAAVLGATAGGGDTRAARSAGVPGAEDEAAGAGTGSGATPEARGADDARELGAGERGSETVVCAADRCRPTTRATAASTTTAPPSTHTMGPLRRRDAARTG